MPSSIQVLIEARDEASTKVEAFKGKLKDMDRGALEATRSVRELSRGVLAELSPALSGVTSQLATVTRGATALSGGMGTLAVGVAAAVAAYVPFIAAVREGTERQAALNLAAQRFDAGAIRSQLAEASREMETMRLRAESFTGTLLNIGRAFTDWIGYTESATDKLKAARSALSQVLPLESETQLTRVLAEQVQVAESLATVDLPKFMRRGDLESALGNLGAVTKALEDQYLLARQLIELEGKSALARAQANKEGPESEANIRKLTEARLKLLDQQSLLKFSQASGLTSDTVSAIRTAQAQADAQSIKLRLQLAGLSPEERLQLQLSGVEADRAAKTAAARDNDRLKALVDEEASIHRINLLRAESERTDPLAGFAAGLREAEEDFSATGRRMQAVAEQTASGLSTAFSDGFFDVLTGKFEDLPDIGRRFAASMVRAITDELGKLATAPLLNQIRSLIPGGGATGGLPFVSETARPLLTTGGRPLSESEISAAYAAGGEAGVRALREGRAAVVGGEFIESGLGGPELTQSAYLLNRPQPSLLSRALPAAGSAAALGLAAFGASGAQSNFDIGASAVLGGLSGLSLGQWIGSAFDASGTGGAIGAVAGAAITAAIAFLSKREADAQAKKAREAAEIERAAGAGSDLVRSASQAQSLPDLFRRITAFGSGYTGGTANPAVSTTVQTPTGPRPIGVPNPTYPVATLQDLLAAPESLAANIQAGVSPEGLAGPNAATSTALQAIARDLVDQFREAEQGVGLTQTDMVDGLTRRTTFPASRADMLDPTRNVEIDELALQALSDDDRAVLLLDVLGRVAVDQDIVSTISDGATGQRVSITRIARSTIALPATPAGLTPEAAAALQATFSLNIPSFTEAPPKGAPLYGQPLYDYIQVGEGGYYVEQPGTGPITGYAAASAEQIAAYNARRAEFYAPYLNQLAPAVTAQLAALSLSEIQAAMTGGLVTPELVAALAQAGLLPQVRSILSPELLAELGPLSGGGDGTGVGVPGLPGLPGDITGATLGQAAIAGIKAAIANAASVGVGIGPSIDFGGLFGANNTLSGAQKAFVGLAGFLGMFAPFTGSSLVAKGLTAFSLGFANYLTAVVNNALAARGEAAMGGVTPEALAIAISNDPAVTLSATLGQAAAQGATYFSLTPAEAAIASQFGVTVFADANSPTGYSATQGYVAGTPTPTGATGPGSVGFGAGVVGGDAGGGPGGGTAPGEGAGPGGQSP